MSSWWRHLTRCTAILVAAMLAILGPVWGQTAICPKDVVTCCQIPSLPLAKQNSRLGIGLQVWLEDLQGLPDQLRKFGPQAVRYAAGPSWHRMPRLASNLDYPAVRNYVAQSLDRDSDRIAKQVESTKSFFGTSGAEAHFVIWAPPVSDAEPPELNAARDKRTLPEGAVPVTAKFYVALLSEMQRRGFPIDVVELSNEPDGDWNIAIPPARYVRLVGEVRTQAKAHGVRLPRISGPGVSRISALRPYLAHPQLGRELVASVDDISVHAWDDRVGRDQVDEARAARLQLTRLGYDKPVIVSEFALTFMDPSDRSRGIGANRRHQNAISSTQSYAARSTAIALNMAALGFGPIIYWELHDQPWGKASYGLYDRNGTGRPLLNELQHLSQLAKNLGPVQIVALASNRVFGLMRDSEIIALAMVNASASAVSLAFDVEMQKRMLGAQVESTGQIRRCIGGRPNALVFDANGFAAFKLK